MFSFLLTQDTSARISSPGEHGYEISVPNKVDNWRLVISCRESGFALLAGLSAKAYGGAESQQYEIDRFLAAQAYLSANWALCDSVTSWFGKALCYESKAHVEKDSLKLPRLERFIPERLAIWVRDQFGYAVALSYQIRNCFVHDGGIGFFQGPDQHSGLAIKDAKWTELQGCPEVKGSLQKRRSAFILDEAERDLGVVLQCCETEPDEALGTLLVSACALIDGHLGFAASAST